MNPRNLMRIAGRAAAAAVALPTSLAFADVNPHAGMLRYPDVGKTHIVFVYAGDLWLVPREGGMAVRLASPPGPELFPRFSPDEKTVAFVGNYDGNRDLYTVPIEGGPALRVSHHPGNETLCDWTPDGKFLIYSTSGLGGLRRQTQLMLAPATGGMPSHLPVPYGANGSISADGTWLAYTPHSTDFRTWKRYRGGMATDVWLFNLKDKTSKRITDWEGTDTIPMWFGDKVYYLSDRGAGDDGYDGDHRLNIWEYDTSTNRRRQVTTLKDFDVKWPSIGPGPDGKGEIVFQHGAGLYLLSLSEGAQPRAITVTIPGDRPAIRPRTVEADKFITDWTISPSAKRVAVEARGDIWSLPAENGTPRNLTRTSGAAERNPAWSPDGRWIAYFSDATGEYELYVAQSDGLGRSIQLTSDGSAPHKFRYNPTWSPDSRKLAFTDKTGTTYLCVLSEPDAEGGIEATRIFKVDQDPGANIVPISWSPDSRWMAYARQDEGNTHYAIWLYNVETEKATRVTSGMFDDASPVFDRKGDWLYFASSRYFSPTYSDIDTTFIYNGSQRLIAIPLRADIAAPWAPKSDEEEWGKPKTDKDGEKKGNGKDGDKPEDKPADKKESAAGQAGGEIYQPSKENPEAGDKEEKDKKDGDAKGSKPKPVVIDLDDMEARAVIVPVPPGRFGRIAVNDKGHLVYVRHPIGRDGDAEIKIFNPTDEKKEEKTVAKGAGFEITPDGKKLLVRRGRESQIMDAAADAKGKPVVTAGMLATINPREEWRQIFTDAWRIQRDFFYVDNMHGVDWQAMREHYGRMLEDAASRDDVSYVIAEMISELNIGHAYYNGGDVEAGPTLPCGMLGCDFELVKGENGQPDAYRITKIYRGAPWDVDAKGPLSQPGVFVKEGDYLLAVNGVPVDTTKDPWAAFQGLAGKVITITVNDTPSLERAAVQPPRKADDADADGRAGPKPDRYSGLRDFVVRAEASEDELRYRDWIESKRRYVEEKSGGKLGYIYVPNTGRDGQSDLFRQFYGQIDKAGLIIDERWNGGGQIPTRFIELLNRPVTNYWAVRDGRDWTWPPDSHQGPKCMLINGLAGSGGDMFPWLFRYNGIGKLIGTRTWGGLVGISGNPGLIDGGAVTAPTFGFYKKDGTWGVEGHGVDPDIEVIDDPAKMQDGGDPQLDVAIAHLLEEVQKNGYKPPKRPKAPDRRGMGIPAEDR